jgi:NAD(P)-dependent dehydrogenase (short-subunit alcohol dehydrogenase family)
VNVRDRAAIITGSGGGIGEGVAKMLAEHGAMVCVTDIVPEKVDRVVKEIEAEGGTVTGLVTDVTKADQVEAMCQHVEYEFGSLDILVNNAAIITPEVDVGEMPDDIWDRVIETNLRSQFLCCRAAVRRMKAQQYGRIVNIVSRSWLGGAGIANYAASKGGIIGLTRSLAMEGGKYGITANCVSPTLVITPLFLGMPKEEQERDRKRAAQNPIPRLGLPSDIAFAVLFFASEEAEYITGQHLYVGGGGDLKTSGTGG